MLQPETIRRHTCFVGLVLVLLIGAALRLAWPEDIEYKYDEAWTFENVTDVRRTETWPWVGIESSAKAPNPGMSLWVFVGLARLANVQDPPDLAQAVQVLNIIALAGLAVFCFRVVPKEEREPWLWATALVAVNPFAVLFQRKIWPPSVLPIFLLAFLAGWWLRDRRKWAFVWGLAGMLLGQIHLSGFFLLAGFAGWAAAFHRRSARWRAWLAGCAVGALPLIPWIYNIISESGLRAAASRRWYHVFEFKFWTNWVTEPLGLSMKYTLGQDFGDFLRHPLIDGQPTYLVAVAHVAIISAGAGILIRAALAFWRSPNRIDEFGIGRNSPTAFTICAALWGAGILLTLSGSVIYRHYLLIVFPLTFVWLARLALTGGSVPLGRGLMTTVCLAQLLVSASLLGYVHGKGTRIRGDYGTPYSAQSETDRQELTTVASPASTEPRSKPALPLRIPPLPSAAD
jgi:hypothetical protein